jgi:hypothetical protein
LLHLSEIQYMFIYIYEYMLLFSDLHLSPKTFRTCMKVLRRVHKEAFERQISVGFLGDFFDRVYNEGTNDLKKEGWKYKSKDQLLLSQLALKNKIN